MTSLPHFHRIKIHILEQFHFQIADQSYQSGLIISPINLNPKTPPSYIPILNSTTPSQPTSPRPPLSKMPYPSLLLLLLTAILLPPTPAKTISQTWTISFKTISPDGVAKTVPVVNGQYPGPTLRAHVNDFIRITVVNNLNESTSLHWHGIKQKGTVWSDGVPGVTQCPIEPGETFVYTFMLDTPGTLWWHSHTNFQKSSLQGAIIITGDEDSVGKFPERLLILNDWYHRQGNDQIAGLLQPPETFVWIGDAESIHINGRGDFNCSETEKPCDPNSSEKGPAIIDVEPDTTYRLRIIGTSSLAFFNLNIDNHTMSIVEVETSLIQPFSTAYLDVATGQSFSALLRTKSLEQLKATPQNNGLFYIQTNIRHEDTGKRGLAILRYSANSGEKLPRRPPPAWPGRNDLSWSLAHARRFKQKDPVPLPNPTRTLTILGTNVFRMDGTAGWAINNISLELPANPLMHQLWLGTEEDRADWMSQPTIPTVYDYRKSSVELGMSPVALSGVHVEPFEKDEVVDIVFQNAVNLGGFDQLHPWHLHLHNFWVLGFGNENETWTPEMTSRYDTTTPVYRNTFVLYPSGWTAIRVKFDNPGFAHFHCHILAHLISGMGFVAQIGGAQDLTWPTHWTQMCFKGAAVGTNILSETFSGR